MLAFREFVFEFCIYMLLIAVFFANAVVEDSGV